MNINITQFVFISKCSIILNSISMYISEKMKEAVI